MIRLIVALIGLFLLWLWLASPFSKRTKIVTSLLAVIGAVSLVVYEVYDNTPRHGLIEPSQISVCGLSVNHSYRSDYKAILCLDNTTTATVKRVTFQVVGRDCTAAEACDNLEAISRDRMVTIAPLSSIELQETVRFETIFPEDEVSWAATIVEVKAVP